MANTSIEWTRNDDGTAGKTWNPLLGCERVSAGCDGCYAITTATIRAGNPHPKVAAAFAGLTERRDGRLDWTGRINLLPDRLNQPLGWKKPQRIFVNSQSDLFHKDVPTEFIAQVFAVIATAKQHTFQLLTKRHGRMRSLLNSVDFQRAVGIAIVRREGGDGPWKYDDAHLAVPKVWPLPNLHLGVSVEDQKAADLRVPALLDTPAAVRWLSCEPLIGSIDLAKFLHWRPIGENLRHAPLPPSFAEACGLPTLRWVVVGGESGAKSRPMHPEWATSLRDQCVDASIPFLFKQWGEWAPFVAGVAPGKEIRAYPGFMVQRVGKKAAGRDLCGRTWDEFPAERVAVTA